MPQAVPLDVTFQYMILIETPLRMGGRVLRHALLRGSERALCV